MLVHRVFNINVAVTCEARHAYSGPAPDAKQRTRWVTSPGLITRVFLTVFLCSILYYILLPLLYLVVIGIVVDCVTFQVAFEYFLFVFRKWCSKLNTFTWRFVYWLSDRIFVCGRHDGRGLMVLLVEVEVFMVEFVGGWTRLLVCWRHWPYFEGDRFVLFDLFAYVQVTLISVCIFLL